MLDWLNYFVLDDHAELSVDWSDVEDESADEPAVGDEDYYDSADEPEIIVIHSDSDSDVEVVDPPAKRARVEEPVEVSSEEEPAVGDEDYYDSADEYYFPPSPVRSDDDIVMVFAGKFMGPSFSV